MHITGGRWKGRKVACPPGIIRPAMGRMRESMFSILGPLDGLSFLDLFAGSGLMALEALSRGAGRSLLVEKDHGKRRIILNNLKIAEEADVRLLIRPVERVLKSSLGLWDLVHMDPPFHMKDKQRILEMAERAGQPAPGGVLTLHHPGEEVLPEVIGGLKHRDSRRYGRSRLAFYVRD